MAAVFNHIDNDGLRHFRRYLSLSVTRSNSAADAVPCSTILSFLRMSQNFNLCAILSGTYGALVSLFLSLLLHYSLWLYVI